MHWLTYLCFLISVLIAGSDWLGFWKLPEPSFGLLLTVTSLGGVILFRSVTAHQHHRQQQRNIQTRRHS